MCIITTLSYYLTHAIRLSCEADPHIGVGTIDFFIPSLSSVCSMCSCSIFWLPRNLSLLFLFEVDDLSFFLNIVLIGWAEEMMLGSQCAAAVLACTDNSPLRSPARRVSITTRIPDTSGRLDIFFATRSPGLEMLLFYHKAFAAAGFSSVRLCAVRRLSPHPGVAPGVAGFLIFFCFVFSFCATPPRHGDFVPPVRVVLIVRLVQVWFGFLCAKSSPNGSVACETVESR